VRVKGLLEHDSKIRSAISALATEPYPYRASSLEREAERRVFYVAFTRAKKRVVMLVSPRGKAALSPYISELGYSVE